ncbi:MAG TPA: hypothetical protein VH575_22760, partial [Gemmataceae bacterium]
PIGSFFIVENLANVSILRHAILARDDLPKNLASFWETGGSAEDGKRGRESERGTEKGTETRDSSRNSQETKDFHASFRRVYF